jgi:flavin-dependent dehydrogenase
LPEKVFGRKFNKLLFFERGNSQDFQMESDFCATLDRKKLSDWQLEESEKAGAKIWFGSNVKKILEDKIELRGGVERFNSKILSVLMEAIQLSEGV